MARLSMTATTEAEAAAAATTRACVANILLRSNLWMTTLLTAMVMSLSKRMQRRSRRYTVTVRSRTARLTYFYLLVPLIAGQ